MFVEILVVYFGLFMIIFFLVLFKINGIVVYVILDFFGSIESF